MKSLTSLLGVLLILSINTNAQSRGALSLNAYGSYTFQERVPLDAFYTDIQGGFQWGAGLEYFVQRNKSIELKYQRMDTKSPLFRPNGEQVNKGNDDAALNYIMLGGNNYFTSSMNDKVVPYVGGDIGIGIAEGPSSNSGAKFAWGAKAGVKIKTSSAVSFKLHAYIQSMVSTFGTDFWYYPGWGTYAVADYATILQFGLGGAVCFDFNKK
jgi:opacity protein-like surface antigen